MIICKTIKSWHNFFIYFSFPKSLTKNKHFIHEIQLIKSFQDKLFILQNKLITELDINNLDELQKYDLNEKPYLIQFKDTSRNFIIFYTNEIHEINYMKSYFITEKKDYIKKQKKFKL